jgi:hypothetical protein
VVCWCRLRRIDGGDLFRVATSVQRTSGGYRDNSYVRVSPLITCQLSMVLIPHHHSLSVRAPSG